MFKIILSLLLIISVSSAHAYCIASGFSVQVKDEIIESKAQGKI